MATALKIIAKRNGFRRAGYEFSDTQETIIPTDDLKKDQIEALKSESNLLVSEIELSNKAAKADTDAEAKAAADAKAKAEADAKKAGNGKK